MTSQDRARNYSDLATMVTTIVRFHVDTTRTDMAFLSRALDGGSLPEEVADVLRPVIAKLLTADQNAPVILLSADLIQLDALHEEIGAASEQRRATQTKLQAVIIGKAWCNAEQALATQRGLQVLPIDARSLDLLSRELGQSDFSVDKIIDVFGSETNSLKEFSAQWMADGLAYGEEWDPDEGNQQEGRQPGTVLGMRQGFLVSHAILYLYAARLPDALPRFLKRRRMPHASSLAEDVIRVCRKAKDAGSKRPTP